ncbi:glycosyltransferase family 4 protein [Salipiger sp.]|uniref:glycosyltransferase family 4 protein n=1 Tax=Salipiger sp. TaxID=2078585 RepID=UPI003A97CD2D
MSRPRVLLCPDTPNWAFDNIADQIIRHHGDRYEFERYYMAGSSGYPHVFLNQVFNIMAPFDIVHFFWREDVQHLLNPETLYRAATEFRIAPDTLFDRLSRPVITSSVYDHLFLEPEHYPWRERAFWYLDGYSVSSGVLDDIYRGIEMFPDPVAVIPDGVDLDRFRPARLERLAETGRPLRVGWVGNSAWGNDPRRDAKGLHSILDPAIERLQNHGHAIERHYADSTVRRRSRDEMVTYYGEIDVLVCSSEIEGTPNPVLEAMASGVPVVSTRVGIVPDVLGPLQSAFILPRRGVAEMTEALRRLLDERTLLPRLSDENLERIRDWSWAETTRGWPAFWEAATARHDAGQRAPLKRHLLRERYAAWYADNVRYKDAWTHASGPAKQVRGLHQMAVDWIYRTPRRAAIVNRLRGRG